MSRKDKEADEYLRKMFSLRDDLLARSGMEGNTTVNSYRDLLGYGASSFHYDGDDYYDGYESDYDHTPVDFLRPDGDIEGKDVQWCKDNGFFQVREGNAALGEYPLWSGSWYYDQKKGNNRKEVKTFSKGASYGVPERNSQRKYNWTRHNDESKQKAAEDFTSKFASLCLNAEKSERLVGKRDVSLNLNANASEFRPASSMTSRKTAGTTTHKSKKKKVHKTNHACKQCGKEFPKLFFALHHMRKCCPEVLADNIEAPNFALDKSFYECMMCWKKYPTEDECIEHCGKSCAIAKKFDLEPISFVKFNLRCRYVCPTCGKEHAKWNKCLDHMSDCCPEILFK